ERPLAPVGERPEERTRREVADRRVGEGLEAVVQDVLRAGDVQRPEKHRREQHEIDDGQTAHFAKVAMMVDPQFGSHGRGEGMHQAARLTRASLRHLCLDDGRGGRDAPREGPDPWSWPMGGDHLGSAPMEREPPRDDVGALVGPATPHFAYQIRARVEELTAGLPEDSAVRRYAVEQMERLDRLGHASSKADEGDRESPTRLGWDEIPS